MKDLHIFYAPDAATSTELPAEEAGHALRVLRMKVGDDMVLSDGKGCYYHAYITEIRRSSCSYRIEDTLVEEPEWQGHLHLAMAPTKLIDRVEWFAEKATEIGFDELSFLDCQYSERHVVKEERIDKILVSAMKQSKRAWKPKLNKMISFKDFITQEREGDKFICHCHFPFAEEGGQRPLLFDVLRPGVPTTVLIGPEGDFSAEEVLSSLHHGYKSVTLGRSRLRTETAALVAVHMMQLKNM